MLEEDPAALLYTSGTTGRPKEAVFSHRALSYSAQTLAAQWGFSSPDVLLHTLPIFHSHGLFISFNVALVSGARLLLRSKFDAADAIEALSRSTVFMGVPTFYHRLLALPSLTKDACRNVRLFVSGSAPLSADVHQEFEARTGQRILERYGSTEAMILCSNPLVGERRPGSERLIGSIRRECTDHIVMFGERHLRHVLLSYMGYYNGTRTHLSLNKDAPISRAAENAGRISVVRSWAGCTINMAGCDLRWAQRKLFDELLGCKLCF